MINIQKLSEEFEYLRVKLKEASLYLAKNEIVEASFILGKLHSDCANHSRYFASLITQANASNDEINQIPLGEPKD